MRAQKNIILSEFTTSGVGGPAKYFYKADSVDKLIEAVNWAGSKKLPFFILGGGSNVIFADKGFPGLVIKNDIKGIVGFRQIIKVGTGTLLSKLISFTVSEHLSGLEKLAGIPGTVGGAVFGNAGAYGEAAGDRITKVICFDPKQNKIVSLTKKQCKFDYRSSAFKTNNLLILEVHFKLTKKTGNLSMEVKEILKKRGEKNFWQDKNPGSFFKNIPVEKISPETLKLIPKDKIIHGKVTAGYLLESINAKGKKVGNIAVSADHANLLVNIGEGKAEDFYNLAKILISGVKDKFGIILEPEVQLINFPSL